VSVRLRRSREAIARPAGRKINREFLSVLGYWPFGPVLDQIFGGPNIWGPGAVGPVALGDIRACGEILFENKSKCFSNKLCLDTDASKFYVQSRS
jgi:hypothetical protein